MRQDFLDILYVEVNAIKSAYNYYVDYFMVT